MRGSPWRLPGDEGEAVAPREETVAEQTKTGTVKKVDMDGGHLVVAAARELTFTVTNHTEITQGGQARKLADIKAAGQVTVTYVKEGDTRAARRIEILPGKLPASPTTRRKQRHPRRDLTIPRSRCRWVRTRGLVCFTCPQGTATGGYCLS